MPVFKLTPEFIEKAHKRYIMVRKMVNERAELALKYADYSPEDLAALWEVDMETVKRYMKDFTKVPPRKLWLLGRACNVWVDYFPKTMFWEDLMIKYMDIPETDEAYAKPEK